MGELTVSRAVAAVRAPELPEPEQLARSLVHAGLALIEVTLTCAGALDAINAAASVPGSFGGAGTVRSSADVRDCAAAGAAFVVSPCVWRTWLALPRRRTCR